jgi:hypothetical protein
MTARTLWLTVLLVASGSAGWSAPAYLPPVISVPEVTKAPQVDGKVEPAEWAKAAVLSDFVCLGGDSLPKLHTVVYAQYDASNFYLAAVCSDPDPANLRTAADKRDGPVLDDDCIEFIVDTVGQRKDAAHLAVNAANVQYDSWNADVSQDFKWTSATSRGPDGWSVELALPFARGIGPAVGDSWLINVARNAPAAGELSSWAPATKSMLELDRLGPLIFSGPPFRVVQRRLGDLWLGQNLAQLEVTTWKSGAGALPAKLNARVDSGGRSILNMEKITVGAEPSVIGLSYRVPSDGRSTVTLALTVAGPQGKAVVAWRSAAYPINAPPVSAGLEALEKTLSDTLLMWAGLPAGERKDTLQQNLAEMLTARESLARRVEQRQGLSREEYGNLLTEVQILNQTAQALQAQVRGGG